MAERVLGLQPLGDGEVGVEIVAYRNVGVAGARASDLEEDLAGAGCGLLNVLDLGERLPVREANGLHCFFLARRAGSPPGTTRASAFTSIVGTEA